MRVDAWRRQYLVAPRQGAGDGDPAARDVEPPEVAEIVDVPLDRRLLDGGSARSGPVDGHRLGHMPCDQRLDQDMQVFGEQVVGGETTEFVERGLSAAAKAAPPVAVPA